MEDLRDSLAKRAANRERLKEEAPDLYEGFNGLMQRCYKHGALERKHKELMAVTASVATRCVPCLANHADNAVSAGATRPEVLEAAAIGVEFGGGPSFVVVRDYLLEFLDTIQAGRAPGNNSQGPGGVGRGQPSLGNVDWATSLTGWESYGLPRDHQRGSLRADCQHQGQIPYRAIA
jgi:AhpD family alkylhydroperoxidase